MFVQEEKIFAGKVLRLHICASDGAEWLEEATEDTSVEKLKERCLKHVRPGRGSRPAPARPLLQRPCFPTPTPPAARRRPPRAEAPHARLPPPAGRETEAGDAKARRGAGPYGFPALVLSCAWG